MIEQGGSSKGVGPTEIKAVGRRGKERKKNRFTGISIQLDGNKKFSRVL